jgi:hypothetical protein
VERHDHGFTAGLHHTQQPVPSTAPDDEAGAVCLAVPPVAAELDDLDTREVRHCTGETRSRQRIAQVRRQRRIFTPQR